MSTHSKVWEIGVFGPVTFHDFCYARVRNKTTSRFGESFV